MEINDINDFEKYLKDSKYINQTIIHYNMQYFIYSNFKLIRSVLINLYQKTKDESIVKDEKK